LLLRTIILCTQGIFCLTRTETRYHTGTIFTESNCEDHENDTEDREDYDEDKKISEDYKTCAIWGNGRVKQYDGSTFQVALFVGFQKLT
jgi:hypothetical protein